MTPAIINTKTKEVVYEGIDYIDCFDTLRNHFMANISNPGNYQVIDLDTGEKANYSEIKRIQNAARNMLAYGG